MKYTPPKKGFLAIIALDLILSVLPIIIEHYNYNGIFSYPFYIACLWLGLTIFAVLITSSKKMRWLFLLLPVAFFNQLLFAWVMLCWTLNGFAP